MNTLDRVPFSRRLWALLRLRCPVCLEGALFGSLMGMHRNCPVCGVAYEREHGYYLNSMFIAYALGFLVIVPSAVLLALRNVSVGLFSVVIIAETLIVWPLIFRYARAIWVHVDQMLDPRARPER
jgi:uncharacterized protein (DUF983 family)